MTTRGLAMKHRNPWAAWLLLPFITLGVYHLVWYFKVNKELGEYDPRRPTSPWTSLLAITLGALLVIPPFVSVWNTGARIRDTQRTAGLEPTCSPLAGLLLTFVLGLHVFYYQHELNKITDLAPVAPHEPVLLPV